MEQKKYVDIERLKDKYATAFTVGEHITITEKVDGANAAVAVDFDNTIAAFSRRNRLTMANTLQGFWEFVQGLNPQKLIDALGQRYILFGEWLVKHTIRYPDTAYKQFYVFDIWDKEIEQYTPWEFTLNVAKQLDLKTVPLFYNGKFKSWDDIYSYVGKTQLDAEPTGEGVVVKSQDRLDNKFSGTPAYVKIVAKEFSEVHQSKVHEVNPEKLAAREAALEATKIIVTKRRVDKILQKFVEDEVIPYDWDEHNLGQIAKILPKACYEDCVKEEPETVKSIENFGKLCASVSMGLARELIK